MFDLVNTLSDTSVVQYSRLDE